MGTTPQIQSSLTDLCALAGKHGTDKLGYYTPIYDLILGPRRDRTFNVLELGIGTPETMGHVRNYRIGASLRMWADYFTRAQVHGVDSDSNAVNYVNSSGNPRIKAIQCDTASPDQLKSHMHELGLLGRFDLIIDDSSHKPEDQGLAFRFLAPLLATEALYIIEDVVSYHSYLETYLDDTPHSFVEHSPCVQGNRDAGRFILIRGEVI